MFTGGYRSPLHQTSSFLFCGTPITQCPISRRTNEEKMRLAIRHFPSCTSDVSYLFAMCDPIPFSVLFSPLPWRCRQINKLRYSNKITQDDRLWPVICRFGFSISFFFWSTSVFLLDSLLNMRNNKQTQKNNDYCFGTRN